jgi:nitrite reductase/ring-hydroxylating ferredoxin subunit
MSGQQRLLCRFDALEDPGTRGFTLNLPSGSLQMFVVRRHGRVYAYRNSCPHTGVALEWQRHRFLDPERELIQCSLHGALFRVETGECLRGPCLGAYPEPLPVWVRHGAVLLAQPRPGLARTGE